MRKTVPVILIFCMASVCINPAWAAEYVQLPKSDADRQSVLNNITDFFATVGKPKDEKARVVKERKAIRREERLRYQRHRQDKVTQKQMKKQQKEIMKKVNAVNQSRYQKKK